MKKYFWFLLLSLTFCSSDDTIEKDYTKNLIGDYKLISMQCNTPVDLNLDGFAQKNLIEEVDCIYHDSFNFFQIQIRSNGSKFKNLGYNIIHSYSVRYENPPYNYQCFSSESMSYSFNFDSRKIIEVVKGDYVDDRENEYGRLKSIDYIESEKKITTKIEKEIYTSEGWKTVIITSVYKNIYDDDLAP